MIWVFEKWQIDIFHLNCDIIDPYQYRPFIFCVKCKITVYRLGLCWLFLKLLLNSKYDFSAAVFRSIHPMYHVKV